jgi:UDP-N-acetylglucosamine--N-acetylmuramyl-(pentapeptide) pyrophosphoryl-undecaprenol N-acetylglucosamine transferase
MPKALLTRLELVMQCREEDLEATREALSALPLAGLSLQPFFADLPRRMAKAHLVICRAGASTIAELMVIGRPAILIPYPHLADDEQGKNAEAFGHAGAGCVLRQEKATPPQLAALVTELAHKPEMLEAAHEAALAQARPDAAERMADAVEEVLAAQAADKDSAAADGNEAPPQDA